MGRSHSKHEDGAGGIDSGKIKDSKPQVKPEQNAHTHQGNSQASTSRQRKSLVHSTHLEASVDKPGKKKRVIPKIIVSGPSNEQLTTTIDDELPETKTIRDTEDYGPYTVHSRPSTIDAYRSTRGEQ
ncbi:spermatogenesis-associated protein 33 [Paroedura picta]|uniref:spermatogenesis-associated protein 33 n=1 Tax=Paroedura picta TaxID=143630 RepID=UPI004057B8C2